MLEPSFPSPSLELSSLTFEWDDYDTEAFLDGLAGEHRPVVGEFEGSPLDARLAYGLLVVEWLVRTVGWHERPEVAEVITSGWDRETSEFDEESDPPDHAIECALLIVENLLIGIYDDTIEGTFENGGFYELTSLEALVLHVIPTEERPSFEAFCRRAWTAANALVEGPGTEPSDDPPSREDAVRRLLAA
ncbi:MAG: hypothetical protein ACE37F_03580 [Nannocystaceae bacterium]|nr:hypothetical protein [bacterium]